jgi:hypothetical protein
MPFWWRNVMTVCGADHAFDGAASDAEPWDVARVTTRGAGDAPACTRSGSATAHTAHPPTPPSPYECTTDACRAAERAAQRKAAAEARKADKQGARAAATAARRDSAAAKKLTKKEKTAAEQLLPLVRK